MLSYGLYTCQRVSWQVLWWIRTVIYRIDHWIQFYRTSKMMSKSIFDLYLFMVMSQEDPLFRQVLCHASVWSISSWLWPLTHPHKHFVVPKIDILGPENWETDVNLIEFLNNQTETQKFDRQKSLLCCSEWVHSVIYSNMFVCRGEKIQIWSEWESHHEKSIWFPWHHNETVGRSRTS